MGNAGNGPALVTLRCCSPAPQALAAAGGFREPRAALALPGPASAILVRNLIRLVALSGQRALDSSVGQQLL